MTAEAGSAGERGVGLFRVAAAGLTAAVAVLAACGGKSPPDGLEPVERFEWGLERFEEGDMGSARSGFREFLVDDPLHPRADSAQYMLGEALYRDGRHVEAAEAFSRLASNRPTSPLADDAQLGVCRSYWELSPDLPLEQEYTRQAADACARVVEFYSPTPLEEEAREIRRKALDKLARKRYRIAEWYFDNGAYESANIYLEQILDDFPDSGVVPRALSTLFRSYRELGFDAEAREVRRRLMEDYP
ncbi:MAG: outer membrane protein assembly factor BamD, partial [Gemmatimonadota bacterium]